MVQLFSYSVRFTQFCCTCQTLATVGCAALPKWPLQMFSKYLRMNKYFWIAVLSTGWESARMMWAKKIASH